MSDTRMTASLPTLDVEMVRRDHPEENAESVTLTIKATPNFDATVGLLAPVALAQLSSIASNATLGPAAAFAANPFAVWARFVEALWRPWLGLPTPGAAPPARLEGGRTDQA